MASNFDVVIMTDLRFPGGSSASTLEEVRIQHEHSVKTGLFHSPSSVIRSTKHFHPGILNSILDDHCKLLNFETEITSKILVVRHPSVINPVSELPVISVERVVLIVNHPPANAVGRIDYILPFVIKTLQEFYGSPPLVFPIGPLIREAIGKYYGDTVKLETTDWLNLFDVARYKTNRRVPGRPLRIGRHSRPGREKWPNTRHAIEAAYLANSRHPVFILGGAGVPETILGYKPKNWIVYPFGSVDVSEFLRSIDVFIYYHHPEWTEAFGRVIAEAMASGLPTILPHHFKPLFKDAGIYAFPEEVPRMVSELSDPEVYAEASQRAEFFITHNFDRGLHIRRLMKIHPGLKTRGLVEA